MSKRIEGVFSAIGDWLEKEVEAERLKAMRVVFFNIEARLEERIRNANDTTDRALLTNVLSDVRGIAAVMGAE